MRTVHGVFTTLLTRMYPILLQDEFVSGPSIVSAQYMYSMLQQNWMPPPGTRSQISDIEVSSTAHNAGRLRMSVRGVSKPSTSVTGDYCGVSSARDL